MMTQHEKFSALTDVEMNLEHGKRKKNFITMNIAFILLVVVSILNYLAGNSMVFYFLPIVFLPIMIRNGKLFNESKEEMKKRSLPL